MTYVLHQSEETSAADEPIHAYANGLDAEIRTSEQVRNVVLLFIHRFRFHVPVDFMSFDRRGYFGQGYAVLFCSLGHDHLRLVCPADRE